jgi:hypothetical protein
MPYVMVACLEMDPLAGKFSAKMQYVRPALCYLLPVCRHLKIFLI